MKDGTTKLASMKILGLDRMSANGHSDIANWLIKIARSIKKEGANYAPVFNARYFVNTLSDQAK